MKRIGIVMLAFFTCFALAAWPQAQPQIITFDAPGAGTVKSCTGGSNPTLSASTF